jgi:hypothetical protein
MLAASPRPCPPGRVRESPNRHTAAANRRAGWSRSGRGGSPLPYGRDPNVWRICAPASPILLPRCPPPPCPPGRLGGQAPGPAQGSGGKDSQARAVISCVDSAPMGDGRGRCAFAFDGGNSLPGSAVRRHGRSRRARSRAGGCGASAFSYAPLRTLVHLGLAVLHTLRDPRAQREARTPAELPGQAKLHSGDGEVNRSGPSFHQIQDVGGCTVSHHWNRARGSA